MFFVVKISCVSCREAYILVNISYYDVLWYVFHLPTPHGSFSWYDVLFFCLYLFSVSLRYERVTRNALKFHSLYDIRYRYPPPPTAKREFVNGYFFFSRPTRPARPGPIITKNARFGTIFFGTRFLSLFASQSEQRVAVLGPHFGHPSKSALS